jgi:hypothetical protein
MFGPGERQRTSRARAKAAVGMAEWAFAKQDLQALYDAYAAMRQLCADDPDYQILPVPLSSSEPSQTNVRGFGRSFVARYVGRCTLCDGLIAQGDEVVFRSVDRAVAHVACGGGK